MSINCLSGSIVHSLEDPKIKEEDLLVSDDMLCLPDNYKKTLQICERILKNCHRNGILIDIFNGCKIIQFRKIMNKYSKCIANIKVKNLFYYKNIEHLKKDLYHYVSIDDIKNDKILVYDCYVDGFISSEYSAWITGIDKIIDDSNILVISGYERENNRLINIEDIIKINIEKQNDNSKFYNSIKEKIISITEKEEIYDLLIAITYNGMESSRHAFMKLSSRGISSFSKIKMIQSKYNAWKQSYFNLKLKLLKAYYSEEELNVDINLIAVEKMLKNEQEWLTAYYF